MTELETKIISALNTFCFQHIWNEPISEVRTNIVPYLIHTRSMSGNIYYGGQIIPLPTTDTPYYVYTIPENLLTIFTTRQVPNTWIDTASLCNIYDILLHTYHLNGKMLHKGSIYIRKVGVLYLLAVAKNMSMKCLKSTDMSNIRITTYFDSDLVGPINIKTFQIPLHDDNYTHRRQVYDYIQQFQYAPQHTTVFINGYEKLYHDINTLSTNAYIDVINDANEILAFDIDLTDTDKNVGFFSHKDNLYKQLVHIPKLLNPTNKILTHNTADIFVRVKNVDGTIGKGIYLHRCANISVTQITHNDIAITKNILDAFRDYLGTQEITLHIVFRQHEKDNVLVRDKNYIDLLYTLDDQLIIDHLLGKVQADLDFWKATNLEQSTYVSMMFDVPNVLTVDNMSMYVDGLGYYHILALLCKQIVTTDILAWYKEGITYTKPYLFSDIPVYPFMYLNGKKIPHTLVNYGNTSSLSLTVEIDDVLNIKAGDQLTVDMLLDGNKNTYNFTPQNGSSTIDIPYTTFQVFEELTLNNYTVNGLDIVLNKSYKEITNFVGNIVTTTIVDGVRLTFGPLMYGKTFIIQNKYRVFNYSKYIDDVLTAGDPIYLDLIDTARDSGMPVPIFYTPHCRVYLNGKYLIENIDFSVQEFFDKENNLCYKQICIQNLEYLETSNNFVEWFVTAGITENKVNGYVVNDLAANNEQLILLFPEMSMMHIEGLLELSAVDNGNCVKLPIAKYRQGAPFEVSTVVPEDIYNFLRTYHTNDDITRIEILNNYFYGKRPSLPPIVVMDHSHRVFSNFLVTIIRDILNGTLVGVTYDPDETRMVSQLIDYQYLKDRDLVFSDKYDFNYIDAMPHYRQLTVSSISTYKILQQFINLSMPKDTVTSGEIYYDE